MRTLIITTFALSVLAAAPAYAQEFPEDDPVGDDTGGGETAAVESSGDGDSGDSGGARAQLGLGVNRSLSGFAGPEVEYYVGDKWMVHGMASLSILSPDEGDTINVIILAGGAFYRLAGSADTAFMIGGRLDLGFADGDGSTTQVNLEVPVRAQVWLSNMLALHAETGLVVAFVGTDGPVFGPGLAGVPGGTADATVIQLGAGGLFGAAGVTVYWP